MPKSVWIIQGLGDENPQQYELGGRETVGELKRQFSTSLGVHPKDIELSTETKRLTNDSDIIANKVSDGETIHILPRAKAGE